MSSASGLSAKHRSNARRLALQAAALMLAHPQSVHYSQGPNRWEGIEHGMKAWKGQYPKHSDCSSSSTWCIWNGLSHYGVRDTVNGQRWEAGFTGTMLSHGKRVAHQRNWEPCDLLIYGNGGSGEHVAMYLGGGLVFSHGSEAGPFKCAWNYRRDLMAVRRAI